MPLFCDICNNLLTVITTSDDFLFKCPSCYQSYSHTETDTLRYENNKGTDLIRYKTILQNAGQDPVNSKVWKNCQNDKCKNNLVRQVRLSDDMRLINICTKCKFQWIDGIND